MKKRSLAVLGAFSAMVLAYGCASIVSGTSQTITITSNVDGAGIYLDGQQVGTTPFTGKVKKNKESLRVEQAGFRTGTITLSKTLDAMFWGNIIIGGTLGSSTDFATGAAYSYAPATYHVELKADGVSMIQFRQQLAVRKFAMIYIDEISRDLATGEGDYLTALVTLLEVEDRAFAANEIRAALEASHGDQLRFGRNVLDLI